MTVDSQNTVREFRAGPPVIAGDGVLLIAHGREEYVREAIAVARSIKIQNPKISICLATDIASDLYLNTRCIDVIVHHDFGEYRGVSSKLCMDQLTPFEGVTLFVDTDSLAFGDISGFLTRHGGGFEAFGEEFSTVHHWFAPKSIARGLAATELIPCFVGGCYRFDRSIASKECFELARSYFHRYDELGFLRIKNSLKNEEPLFSIAMSNLGLRCVPESLSPMRNVSASSLASVRYTYKRTLADGSIWKDRPLLHFHSFKRSLKYECLREEMLLFRDQNSSLRLARLAFKFAGRRITALFDRFKILDTRR